MKKLYLLSLGCPKNLVDSEVMLGLLCAAGYTLVEEPAAADVLLVNTCGFISSAAEEAVDEILTLAQLKQQDPAKRLVVTGCLVQRYGIELRKELPEVDLFVGTESISEIVELLRRQPQGDETELAASTKPFLMDSSLPRQLATPPHRAYLKITEGCANRCSYCMIPAIRGPLRSRTIPDLVIETRRLAAGGVKELTLIAQDLLAYGRDLDSATNLQALLAALLAATDIPWLRLLYLHPARLDKKMLAFIAEHPRVLPYLDIPVQHVSSRILKLMARPYDRGRLERLLAEVREVLPGAALRTTLMVGFPGETEAEVDELAEFLLQHRFAHVGVFSYSNEEGCRAASLPDHCPEEIKTQRHDRIMKLQAEISAENLRRYIGKTEKVLVEGVSRESDLLLEGRTWFQAPEIDGCLYITAGEVRPGAMLAVRVTDAHFYDLVGEVVC